MRSFVSLKEETYLALKGASARALVAIACMVFVSVSYDVNVEPAKVVLTRSLVLFFFLAIWFWCLFSSSVETFFVFCDERTQRKFDS